MYADISKEVPKICLTGDYGYITLGAQEVCYLEHYPVAFERYQTASVVQWSEFLIANPEVLCSIPGAIKFSA
jgi:hypothetical protein